MVTKPVGFSLQAIAAGSRDYINGKLEKYDFRLTVIINL